MQREPFAPDLEKILAPVPGASPCGESIRYDPAFLALRQSRVEDDPSLPMREWERPLQKADWRAVANGCITLLARSKDLQLASWLCDAWIRQHQIEGLNKGVDLLCALVDSYWDGLHPLIEDGDSEARTSSFAWLNEVLPRTLSLQVPLLFLPDYKPPMLNLADWEQVVVSKPSQLRSEEGSEVTRDQLIALADRRNLEWLADLDEQLDAAHEKWDGLSRRLDERLAMDAPSLGKVADTLRKMQRACHSLLDGRNPRAPVAAPVAAAPAEEPAPYQEEPAMSAQPPQAFTQDTTPLPSGPITSRADAYRMLEAAAAFLQRTEPHSPTPYLVKRAVTWGNMSLADLMQEILREEGDLTRYFSLLGINLPRE